MADLKPRADACLDAFTQIIDQCHRSAADARWAGTTENAWGSQKSRLKLWIGDLTLLETESGLQSLDKPYDCASMLQILEDLENDLAEALNVADGERLPLEEEDINLPEDDESLFFDDREEFHEMAERLHSIADVIDCLFRATNTQFDWAMLLENVRSRDYTQPQHESESMAKQKAQQQVGSEMRKQPQHDAANPMRLPQPSAETAVLQSPHRRAEIPMQQRLQHEDQGLLQRMPLKGKGKAVAKPPVRTASASNSTVHGGPTPVQPSPTEPGRSISAASGPDPGENLSSTAMSVAAAAGLVGASMAAIRAARPMPYVASSETSQPQQTRETTRATPAPNWEQLKASGDVTPDHAKATEPEMPSAAKTGQQSLWDSRRGRYYYIDYESREYVYDEGTRLALPQSPSESTKRPRSPGKSSSEAQITSPTGPKSEEGRTVHVEGIEGLFKARPRQYFENFRVFALQPQHTVLDPAPAEPFDILHHGKDQALSVCRFVVIQEADPKADNCLALPILTYGGQGVEAKGVAKYEHGIIHSSRSPPAPGSSEMPTREEGGRGMVPNPVRISADDTGQSLHKTSRINYGQPVRVPLSANVLAIGTVHENSRPTLCAQYQYVQREKECRLYRNEFQKRMGKGQHQQAVLQYLTGMYRQSHPELTWEQAWAVVKRILESP